MAGTATTTYSPDVWTSSVDASQHWEFSVPIRQDSTGNRSKSRSSRGAKSKDRGSKGSRSSSLSRHVYAHDHAPRGRQDAGLTRRGSEAGSALDSVPHTNGTTRKTDANESIGVLNDVDNAKWIHRDKLARIESEELQAILFHRRPGTGSIRATRGRSRDKQHNSTGGSAMTTPPTNEQLEPWPNLLEEQRNHTASPTPADGDGKVDIMDEERRNWDLRRPEEIAADMVEDNASSIYRNPGLRKSSSRIPIPTASPVPLSTEYIDREFSSRPRTLTNGEEDTLAFGMPRRASEPINVDSISNSTPSSDSRPGSRGIQATQVNATKKTPVKATPGSTNRKTSAPPATRKATPRSRTTSNNNNNNSSQRPTTRGGDNRPPTAVNRPEGDPPWLATMYKPDPRLPPDQQILPTHARKMLQEQWAKEGKSPTTYDREFEPLAIAPDPPTTKKEKQEETEEKIEEKQTPALPSPPLPVKPEELGLSPLPKSPDSGTRPSTSTGYSPMPKVQDTPPIGLTPKYNQTTITAQSPPDDKADKGCGCCIVM